MMNIGILLSLALISLFKNPTAYSSDQEIVEGTPSSTACLYPSPSDKLTSQDVDTLKQIWTEVNPAETSKNLLQIPTIPRFGWITPEKLNDLKPLSYISKKNWKDSKDLKDQIMLAAACLGHLTQNIDMFINTKLARSKRDELCSKLRTGCLLATQENQLKIMDALGGLHSTDLPQDFQNFPGIPILQKLMRNLVIYCEQSLKHKSDFSGCGVLPIGGNEVMVLGYIQHYIPVMLENKPGYDFSYAFYKLYAQPYRCGHLVHDLKFVEDSGIIIKDNEVYNLSFINKAFIYNGANSQFPFTISPFELTSFPLKEKVSHALDENIFEKLFADNYPKPGQTTFIALPDTDSEKGVVEILFLEDLKERAVTDEIACNLIKIIEEERGKSIDEIIEELTQHQISIMQEQSRISRQVANHEVSGRLKSKQEKSNSRKKTKAKLKAPASSSIPGLKAEYKTASLSDRFKEELKNKRLKYRKFLQIINKVIKLAPCSNISEGTSGGSHKTIHAETGAATVVKPHGKKDRSISTTSSRRFYEKFTSLIGLNSKQ